MVATALSKVQPAAKQVYTMRDLSNETARVMQEIRKSGEPALITLRGRFIAVLMPLADGELEGVLIGAALERTAEAQLALESREPLSTQEAASRRGITLPEHDDREVSQ